MHPNRRSPFDTRAASERITRSVGRALGLPRTKWGPIKAAVAEEVKQLAAVTRTSRDRVMVSRRKVRAALAGVL